MTHAMTTITGKRQAKRRQFRQAGAARRARQREREALSLVVQVLIARIDELDGDPDMEPDADSESSYDREMDDCDREFGQREWHHGHGRR